MAGEIATAFVSIMPSFKGGAKSLGDQLGGQAAAAGDSAGKSAGSKFSSSFGSTLKIGATLGAAFAVTKGISFFKDAISGASDLNETVSKSAIIFGKNANVIRAWASDAATNLGLSESAALEAAAGFGDMFSQLGFAGDIATQMSKDVVGLSADLGSFNNLPTEDVSQRIAAAFRGEYDSLQALIPTINAARVEQEAMAMTGKANAKELTAQEKAAAVLAIVNHDGARALGDFERTSSGAANTSKILGARFEDLKTRVGQALLPAFQQVLGFGSKILDFFSTGGDKTSAFGKILAKVGPIAKAVFEGAKAAFATFMTVAGVVFTAVKKFLSDNQARFSAWGTKIKELVAIVVPLVKGFIDGFVKGVGAKIPAVAKALGAAFVKVGDALSGVIGFVKDTVKFFKEHQGAAVALKAVIVGLGAAFIAYKIAMLAMSAATKIVSAVTTAFTVVQGILNAVMAMNPIGLVVIALIALAAGLVYAYKNSETFRKIVDAAFQGVKTVVAAVWAFVQPLFKLWALEFKLLWEGAKLLWAGIKAAFEGIVTAATWLWTTVKAAFDGGVAFVAGIPARVVAAVTGLWAFIGTEASEIKDDIIARFNEVVTWVKGLPGMIWDAIGDVSSFLFHKGQQLVQGLIDGFMSMVDTLREHWWSILKIVGLSMPGSPVREGPLRVLNRGYAGGQIVKMLAGGMLAQRGALAQAAGVIAGTAGGFTPNMGAVSSATRSRRFDTAGSGTSQTGSGTTVHATIINPVEKTAGESIDFAAGMARLVGMAL